MVDFRLIHTAIILPVVIFTGCGGGFEFFSPAPSPPPPPDTTPPSIMYFTPSVDAPLVDHEITVNVYFNDPLNRATVNSNTFSLRMPNNTLVNGTYEFYNEDKDVRFVPATPLDGFTQYTSSVTTGITNIVNLHLTEGDSWSFSTAPTGIGNWIPTSLTGPIDTRDSLFITSVWTGSEMLVWGGSSGYRYNPATDTLTAMSLVNSPSQRSGHTAVWTGTEMIIWGGAGGNYVYLNDGARYNPVTDTWHSITLTEAPEGRASHTAVWSGQEMLIWGGRNGGYFAEYPEEGGKYNPSTDSWTAMTTANVPSGRGKHTAVWSGQEMIVWGGISSILSDAYYLSSGGRYNPSTDTWLRTTNTDTPTARGLHTAIWSGSEMIVWGGASGSWDYLESGAKYNPITDTWFPTMTAVGLLPRYGHSAVWAVNAMIIWGGYTHIIDTQLPRTGGLYYPQNDVWLYTTTTNAPVGRTDHAAVWTGSEMIIWGGNTGSGIPLENGGGVYIP